MPQKPNLSFLQAATHPCEPSATAWNRGADDGTPVIDAMEAQGTIIQESGWKDTDLEI